MIGIVVVSHSPALAEAAVELAMQMNQAEFNAVLARTQQTCQQI